jgi:signal transduction histidine kinase/ActR/RegA family two-component response regulator
MVHGMSEHTGSPAPSHQHAVQFYEDDGFLCEKVTTFLAAGLDAGESLVVIATEPHRRAVADALQRRGADVEEACIRGQLFLLDAEETLRRFMVGPVPSWPLFREHVGRLLERAASREREGQPSEKSPVRAFGEMVDLLWKRGNSEGALSLEDHWNELAKTHPHALLCGYGLSQFAKHDQSGPFRRVCAAHADIRPAEGYLVKDEGERLREVAYLQQRARALESEIAERATLEAALREALRERARSERAAHDADRRKDEFLAMLGHELRNPLAPIMTALQLMQLRGKGNEREHQVIDRQVRHLVHLVDDLLDVSRITRGKIELKKESIEVAAVLTKAIEMASPLFEQRAHTLVVGAPREGLLVDADPMRLGQVLANLLTNAAKYTEPGGHVEVTARREGANVAVSVKDDGIGIAPDALADVFELFVQGERTIDRSQGGLGIGLTLAKSLVELHGGTIHVESEGLGRGTEFVVRIPAARPAVPREVPSRERHRLELVKSSGVRVLLVDDNVDAVDVLAESLRSFGHEVATAHDGPEALQIAAEFEPDTAILDLGLPVMDGYELATRLRSARPLRLVALTGYGQESDKMRSRQAGFDVHLVKPVELRTILAFLDEKSGAARRKTH